MNIIDNPMIFPLTRACIDKGSKFPFVLYTMLENAEQEGYADIVSWMPGTDCYYFKVHNALAFTEKVMPRYFNQTRYKSFQRQLNLYCFKQNTKAGPFREAYSHLLFVRGRIELCQLIVRVKDKNNALGSFPPQDASRGPMLPSILSLPSITMSGEQSECHSNEFAVAAFPGQTFKMASVPKNTRHKNTPSVSQHARGPMLPSILPLPSITMSGERSECDSSEFAVAAFPGQTFKMTSVPKNTRHKNTPSVSQHASVPLLANSSSSPSPSTLLYEPQPLIMGDNVSFTSNMNMMNDVEQQDIIDIFGSQKRRR